MEVLFAVLILLGVALICAVLLVVAEHYMGVKKDETVARVRECLPGANCGACGFTGCDGYAEAIVNSGAKTNLCIPGGNTVAEAVAEVMGVAAEATEKKVAIVHCAGTDENSPKKAEFDACGSCRAACLLYAGGEACIYSCLGCGDCADACPKDAISIIDGVAKVNPARCIGCGLCEKTCPKGIISIANRSIKVTVKCSNHDTGALANKVCKVGCIACRKCEKTCPVGAITVENNLAKIDYDKCIGCLQCVEVCPKHTIKEIKL